MPASFSPSLAFGSGLAQGVESAEAAKQANQNKIDDEYRTRALNLSYEEQLDTFKRKQQEDDDNQKYTKIATVAGLTKQNTTNQATFDAMKQSQNQPNITQATGSPPPTNTPQTTLPPQQGQQQPPQAGQMPQMSPQAGAPPTNTDISQAATPVQQPIQNASYTTDPLKAPNAQQGDNQDPSGGQTMPNEPDNMIKDSFGNSLTREQASRAAAYGIEENTKLKGALSPEVAYQLGLGKVLKEDGQLGDGINNTGFNKYGFAIGTVPEGLSAPVLPEKFDETKHMSSVQAGKKTNYDDEALAKDREAATQAMKASQEFSMYLAGNNSGDEGALNKISFVRDFMGAMSSTDGTLDSVNKSLTFNIVGFERTPGMRLTQAEFFIAREAMPGRGNTPEANKNIAQFWQAKLNLPQEWAQFKQDYIVANGSWNEALGQRMFQQYQKDNPIFDPQVMQNPEQAKLSDFKLNPNRQSLEEYAKSGGWSKLSFLGLKPPANPSAQSITNQSPVQTQQNQSNTKQGGFDPNSFLSNFGIK